MRVGIYGYGNLGRAAEIMCMDLDDVELVGIFTRREPDTVRSVYSHVYSEKQIEKFEGKIDCLLVCTGSATSASLDTPRLAELFCVVDSYDCHKLIEEHKARVGIRAERGGKVAVISAGWDPGLLSLVRLYASSFMPYASVNTFWGTGVSQGHSEAIRSIDGVKDAIQYTVPKDDALTLSRTCKRYYTNTEKHKRVCYIVAEEGKEAEIERKVKAIPEYFLGYDTEVHFLRDEDFLEHKHKRNHKGRVIVYGDTGLYHENTALLELELTLASNPEFTAGIMLSTARAACKMKTAGYRGAFTLFDIPPIFFLEKGGSELL